MVRCQYTKVLTKQFLQEFLNKNFLTANENYAKECKELWTKIRKFNRKLKFYSESVTSMKRWHLIKIYFFFKNCNLPTDMSRKSNARFFPMTVGLGKWLDSMFFSQYQHTVDQSMVIFGRMIFTTSKKNKRNFILAL